MRIIQKHEKEFSITPNAGWKGGEFFLISGGRGIKRVYPADSPYLPPFAWNRPGAPEKSEAVKQREAAAANQKTAQETANKNERDRRKTAIADRNKKKASDHDFSASAMIETICAKCGVDRIYHES